VSRGAIPTSNVESFRRKTTRQIKGFPGDFRSEQKDKRAAGRKGKSVLTRTCSMLFYSGKGRHYESRARIKTQEDAYCSPNDAYVQNLPPGNMDRAKTYLFSQPPDKELDEGARDWRGKRSE